MKKILIVIGCLTAGLSAGNCYCEQTIEHNNEKWVLEKQTQVDSLNMVFESDTIMNNIKNKEAFKEKMDKTFPIKGEKKNKERFNNEERSFHQVCKTSTTKKESDIVFTENNNSSYKGTMKTKRLDNKTILKCQYKLQEKKN